MEATANVLAACEAAQEKRELVSMKNSHQVVGAPVTQFWLNCSAQYMS